MNPGIPFYLNVILILVTIFLFIFSVYVINRAFIMYNVEAGKKNLYTGISAFIVIGWLITASIISFRGTLLDFASTPPKMMVIIVPPVLAASYLCSSVRVNNLLKVTPASWLIYMQSFRILIEIILWQLYRIGIIPVQMSFEGYNYDILTGLSAPLIAYYFFTEKKWPKIVPLMWNYAGLLLILNIAFVAFVSTPTPFRQFFNEPANTLPAFFPFVWLPAFIVPLAVTVHILSIKQIMRYY
jgi:hypothetical protein